MLIYLYLDPSSFRREKSERVDDTGTKENDWDISVLFSEGTLIISM